jgi:signal transduction histidine kinase
MVFNSAVGGEWYFQYNGEDMWAYQSGIAFLDCIGTPADDMVLTRVHGDTIVTRIFTFDSSLAVLDTVRLTIAVARASDRPGFFQSLTSNALDAVDVNGDGRKDLLYCLTAKPDSAFVRSVTAYDLQSKSVIWTFPTADCTGHLDFRTLKLSSDSIVFVFSVNSANNNYTSSNGMTSHSAYLVSIGIDGRERWRKVVGDGGFAPKMTVTDVNGDDVCEVIVPCRYDGGAVSSSMVFRCFDVESGRMIAESEQFEANGANVFAATDSVTGSCSIVAAMTTPGENLTARFDQDLKLRALASGPVAYAVLDIDGDGHPETLGHCNWDTFCALDSNLELIATAQSNQNSAEFGKSSAGHFASWSDGNTYHLLSMAKRPLVTFWFGKYKWYLAVALSLAVFVVGMQGIRWVRRLYVSAAGLPGLDRIDAMVMVLDRKGRATFINDHPLARHLIQEPAFRGKSCKLLFGGQATSLIQLVESSYRQPLATFQEQVEVEIEGTAANLLVATYPRLDQNNRFLGKVVVVENITNRVDWQRKVVLGEAAQRWVHKLKGNLATARLYLDNLQEDNRLDDRTRKEVLPDYIPAVQGQIMQTAETASRILRFSSIRKPEPIQCEINTLVDTAVGPYLANPRPNLAVAKTQQPDLPSVKVDPVQMREVLDNLLSNAVFAMKRGGRLTIATRLATDLPSRDMGRMIEIVVEDTGSGIAEEDKARIFQPGFSRSGSTGVGLALVKEIVENHGGRVEVNSRLGEGTTFAVRLPIERTGP